MYIEFFKKSFQQCAVYKANTVIRFFTSFLRLFVTVSIWTALYGSKESVDGIPFANMMTYLLLVEMLYTLTDIKVSDYLSQRIVSGNVALDFIRPINLKTCAIANSLGEAIFGFIVYALPMTLVGAFLLGFSLPVELWHYPMFLLSVILSMTLYSLLEYVMGLSVFWLKTGFHITWTIGALFTLFSGAAVPLWFYPDWLHKIASFLPFSYVIFEPANIFLGESSLSQSLTVIAVQLIWILVFQIAGMILWRLAQKQVVVQGG